MAVFEILLFRMPWEIRSSACGIFRRILRLGFRGLCPDAGLNRKLKILADNVMQRPIWSIRTASLLSPLLTKKLTSLPFIPMLYDCAVNQSARMYSRHSGALPVFGFASGIFNNAYPLPIKTVFPQKANPYFRIRSPGTPLAVSAAS